MRKRLKVLITCYVLALLVVGLPRTHLLSASSLGVANADDDNGRKPTPTCTRKPTPSPTATKKPTPTPTPTKKPTPTSTRKPTPQPTPTCMPQKSKKRPCGDDDGGNY